MGRKGGRRIDPSFGARLRRAGRAARVLAGPVILVACLLAAIPPGASAAWRLYANNYSGSSISGFTLAPDGALSPVPASPFLTGTHFPQALSASPDARFVFVSYPFTTDQLAQVLAIGGDGALSDATGFFPSPNGPFGAVFAPNGRHVYAGFQAGLHAYELSASGGLSELPGSPVAGSSTFGPSLNPDGQHLYALGTAPTRLKRFDIQPDGLPSFVADLPLSYTSMSDIELTPDGRSLYVLGSPSTGNDKVEAFSVAPDGSLGSLGSVIAPGAVARDIAISPDGRFLYLSESNSDTITTYSIASGGGLSQVGQIVTGLGGVQRLAISPDRRFLYAQRDTSPSGTIKVFAIAASGSISPTGASAAVGQSDGTSLPITPDQPPLAAFTVATKSGKQVFDAAGSTDPDSSIGRYDWDFGDGTTTSSSSPVAEHTFKKPGKFGVKLTVTDDAGCSTALVGTGQIAYCNGGAGAQLSREVTSPVPSILSLSVTNRVFVVKGSRVSATARKKRRKRKLGTAFRYRLDRAASVSFTIQRRTRGRRVGGKCRTKTKKNARRKPCTLYKASGKLRHRGKAGRNVKRFSGRLRRRALRPGRYRAVAVATTNDRFKSATRRVSFRVVRR